MEGIVSIKQDELVTPRPIRRVLDREASTRVDVRPAGLRAEVSLTICSEFAPISNPSEPSAMPSSGQRSRPWVVQ
jgi:hypothetical protein